MSGFLEEKALFLTHLKSFAGQLGGHISLENQWTMKGFIDVFQNIYTISNDTKVISKILELHLFPQFLCFAESIDYTIELATHQNWYPDLTFISNKNSDIKFAVDLKTTYRLEDNPDFCNGFTLGSHGEYFINRNSKKNIQYPYSQYSGHFCLGIIYSRASLEDKSETQRYSLEEIEAIPSVIHDFTFFAEEKWKIASDKGGSGNTANIGSIQKIADVLQGNGVFIKAGEAIFDDYWANFGKITIETQDGKKKKLSTLEEYLAYRNLPPALNNPKASKRKKKPAVVEGKIYVPPIKTQGIKTKLVPMIREAVRLTDESVWVEPFMGSGVVGFNIAPYNAVFADSNPHIINFYNHIKDRTITSNIVRDFLEQQGALLEQRGEDYYYEVRERFNANSEPLDFLFLNRSCFNGMIRFNKKFEFNVPFGHKPQRFAKAYVTKIVNQVFRLEEAFANNNWSFACQSFEETIAQADSRCFIYCDPPYIGRHVDYYDSWDEESEIKLFTALEATSALYMISTWDYNEYRTNVYIDQIWDSCYKMNKEHFYHVGAKEKNRKPMVEALLMNYEPRGLPFKSPQGK